MHSSSESKSLRELFDHLLFPFVGLFDAKSGDRSDGAAESCLQHRPCLHGQHALLGVQRRVQKPLESDKGASDRDGVRDAVCGKLQAEVHIGCPLAHFRSSIEQRWGQDEEKF